MKRSTSTSGDLSRVKSSVLGSRSAYVGETIDPATAALVQLCACTLPQMSGPVMAGIERALNIEPRHKPVLRKFIADSYDAQPSIASVVRSYKRAVNPGHDECYKLALRLSGVAREARRTDSASLGNIISAAKALGLTRDEVLSVLQKQRLAA